MRSKIKQLTLPLLFILVGLGLSQNAWARDAQDLNGKITSMYYCGGFNGWATSNADYQFSEKVDGNHYKGTIYAPAGKEKWTFKLYINSSYGSEYYSCGDYGFHSGWGGGEVSIHTDKDDDKLSTIAATSGWVKIDMEFYCQYGSKSYINFSQTAVSALGASLSASSTTISAEGTTTLTSGGTGGSGSYTYSYSDGGAGGSFNGSTYTAPLVTSTTNITITLTVKDAHNVLKDQLTAATTTKTITVNPLTYNVTFNTDGGTINTGNFSTYTKGVGATLPTDVTKTGYTFAGWFLNNEGDRVYSIGTDESGAKSYTAHWTAKSIKFTFERKEGTSSYGSVSKDYDAELTQLNSGYIPSKNGYNFQGYYTADGSSTGEWGSQLINPSGQWQVVSGYTEQIDSKIYNKKSSSCTIYAKWELATYNYTFVQNGGSGATDGTYTINSETITLPIASEMTKTGHNFAGWFTNSGLTEGPVTEIASGSYGNKTFYAKWTAKTYTIRAHSNYGVDNIVEFTATYYQNMVYTGFVPQTRTGYNLSSYYLVNTNTDANLRITNQKADGWVESRSASNTTAPYDVDWTDATKKWIYDGNCDTVGAGPINIYANWAAKQYVITLDNTPVANANCSIKYDQIKTVTPPTNGDYVFAGYYTSTEWTTQVINDQGNFLANVEGYTGANGAWQRDFTGTLTLYAKWDEPSTQKVYFGITNGAATTDQRGTISAKFNDGTKDVNIESGVTEVPSGKVVTITWDNSTPKGQYYIGYQAYKANGWYNNVNITIGTRLQSGTTKTYSPTVGSSDIYAYVNAVDVLYDVTVNQATGGTASAVTAKAGPNVACQVGAVLSNGYSFGGWTLANEGSSKYVNSKDASSNPTQIASTAAATITPSYNLIQYSITYHNVTDATHDNPTNFYVTTPTITLSDASKIGYTFQGWYSDAEFQTQVTQIAEGTYADQVLYAKWEAKQYDITYLDKGGNAFTGTFDGSQPVKHTYDATTTLVNPARDHYTFNGWHKQADCSDAVVTEIGGKEYTSNFTLYAQWTADTYTITYNTNGGSAIEEKLTYTFETATFDLPVSTKTGYNFGGWYNNVELTGSAISQITTGSFGNKVFWAKWVAIKYSADNNLGVKTGEGTAGKYTATYDATTIEIDDDPVRAGYQVVGYYQEAEFTHLIADKNGVLEANTAYTTAESKWIQTSAPTLYTKWEAAPMTINLNVNVGDGEVVDVDYTQGTASVTVTYLSNNYDPNPIENPTREGYEFNGYYTATSAGSQIIDNEGHFVTHDVTDWILNHNWQRSTTETLYAQWTAVPSKITFINNGADLEPGPSVLYATYNTRSGWNEDITISKAGATFGGYWTGENGTGSQLVGSDGKWIANVSEYTGSYGGKPVWKHNGDVTLYAKWTTTGKVVYLKNTMNWDSAFVYFYSGSYWSNDNGTGSNPGGSFQSGPHAMTYNTTNGLFYYVAANDASNTYVSFTKDSQKNFGNFHGTEAIYCNNNFQFDKVVVVEREKNKKYNNNGAKYYADADKLTPEYQTLDAASGTGVFIPGTWSTPTTWESKGFEFAWEDDGTVKKCTLNLAASTEYEFKIFTQGKHYGYNTAISASTAAAGVLFEENKNNCKLTTSAAGNYVFEWKDGNKLRITYPVSHRVYWGMGTVNGSATAPTTSPAISSGSLVQHGNEITFTAYAAKPGYTWRGWYSKQTREEAGSEKLSAGTEFAFTAAIEIANYSAYAIYTENIETVNVSSENVVKGTVEPASVTAGPATASASIAATPEAGYKFDSWTLPQSGAVTIASGSATTTPITINTTAASQEITATFSERYALDGSGQDDQAHGMPGWDDHTTHFTVSGTTATTTVTLEAQTAYKFKLYDKATSNRLALTATTTYTDGVEADAAWDTQVTDTRDKTGVFTSYFAGTYTFTINLETMKVKIDFQHKTIPSIEAGTKAVALDALKLMGDGAEATPYWIWEVNKTADAKIKVDMKKQTPAGAVLNYKFGDETAKPATIVAEQTYFLIDLNDYEIATEAKNKDLLVYYSVDGIDSLGTDGKSFTRAGVYYKYVSDPVVSFYLENANKDVVTEAPVSTTLKMKPTVTGNVAIGNNFTYFYKLTSSDGDWTAIELAADSTFTTPDVHEYYDYKAVWTDNNQAFVAETSYEIYVPYAIQIKTKLGSDAATVKETITMATNGTKATATVDVPEVYGYSYGQSENYYTTTNVSVDGTPGSSSPLTLTSATDNGDITFLYTKRTCQITPSCNPQIGTINPNTVQTGLDMFTSCAFTYTPAAGQSFVKWNIGNAKCASGYNERSNPVVILPTSEEATISPEALEKYVNITLKVVGNGKIKVGGNEVASGTKENVGTFTSKEITQEAYYGYSFTGWTWSDDETTYVDKEEIANGYRITGKGVAKNLVLTATFVENISTGWWLGGSWSKNGDGSWKWDTFFEKHKGETSKSIGYCKITLYSGNTYNFKISSNNQEYGNNGTMTGTYHYGWTFKQSESAACNFTCSTTGDYMFIIDYSDSNNPKVTLLYPDEYIPENTTIYFNNYFNQSNWPSPKFRLGVPGGMAEAYSMTLVPGTANLYKYTFQSGWYNYNKFHICNNWGWTGYKDPSGDTQYGIFNIGQGDYKITHSSCHYDGISVTQQGTEGAYYYEYVIQPTSWKNDGDYGVKYYNTTNFSTLDDSRFTVTYTTPDAAQGTLSVVEWNNADGSNVSNVTSGGKVDQSRWITITATPKTGYRLVSVAVTTADSKTETKNEVSTWKYAVQQNITNIVATFTHCDTYKFYVKNHADWIAGGHDVYIHYWNAGSTKTNWSFPGRMGTKMDDDWYEIEINSNFFDVVGWQLNQGNNERKTQDYSATSGDWKPSDVNGKFYEIVLNTSVSPNIWELQQVSNPNTMYRVVTTMSNGAVYTSNVVTGTDSYMSFFADNEVTSVVLQNNAGGAWSVGTDIKSSFDSANVYIAKAQDANSLKDLAAYSGKYYVRTDGASGGWDNYKAEDKNNAMTYFTPRAGETFSYYWVANLAKGADCNVKAKVANDYNACLAQEIINDKNTDVYGSIKSSTYGSNVRFSYEPSTNSFGRAILAGAASNTFLNLTGNYMYADQQCEAADALSEDNYKNNPKLTVFSDLSDWVYEKNVYVNLPASQSANVDVTSVYNGQTETLVDNRTVMETGTANGLYKIRVVYDFKRNRVIAAWSPSSQEIQSTITVNSDILFLQNETGDVSQITLKTDETQVKSLSYVVYVLEIEDPGAGNRKEVQYRLSLPFDCKISDIYGIDGYMEKWGVQKYDGAKRAQIGWFKDDTKTFWTWMGKDEVMRAGEGYSISIDKSALTWNTVQQEVTRTVCNNEGKDCQDITTTETRASLRLYFPSQTAGFDLKKATAENQQTYEALTCTITSPADRRKQDSDWRFIGSDAYNNIKTNVVTDGRSEESKLAPGYLYVLNNEGTAYVATDGKDFIYHSFKAYMLQFHGTINWAQYTKSEPASSVAARKQVTEDTKIAKMRLDLKEDGEKQAQTFVELNENATYGFDQKMDLTLMSSSKVAQIYTYSQDVAYGANVLPYEDQIIPVSISALHNGDYTIAINGAEKVFVYLIDYQEKTETLLNTEAYEVNLNKGVCEGRFALRIDAKRVVTPVVNTNAANEDNKVIKFIENDQLYIQKEGVIYDATGRVVK